MKKIFLSTLLLTISINIFSSIPSGYYHGIDSLNGESLLLKLNEICSKANFLNYGSGIGCTWYGFYFTDRNSDSTVIDMYSDEIRYQTDFNAVNDMHIEHSFPKSWWGGYENYAFRDLHHIFPADATTNIYKNNLPLGIVDELIYDNGISKIGKSTLYEGNCFEPADKYKGDFARAYFYISAIYHNMYKQWDSPMLDNNSFPMWNPWALNLLLSWHKADPVDEKEMKRQEAVYEIQHNRNPFIDYPTLIDYIWGNKKDSVFRLENDTNAYIYSPTEWDFIDFGTNYINTSHSDTIAVKWNNLTDNIHLKIKNNSPEFHLSADSIITNDKQNSDVIIYSSSNTSKYISDTLIIYSNKTDTIYIPLSGNFIDKFIITNARSISPRSFSASWIMKPDNSTFDIFLFDGYKNNASNIFFSSYVEGSSYNKAITIYNGTGHAVSLDQYSIKKQNNGVGNMKNTLQLSGVLQNDSCFVICNSNASDSLLNKADLIIDYSLENNITNFNGNDAIGLYYHNILIDIIGIINDHTMWGENITLIRKSDILAPNNNYTLDEWNVFPQDYINNIENHFIDRISEKIISTISTTDNCYTFEQLLPSHTYTIIVQDNNNNKTDNAYSIQTPEIDPIEAFPAVFVGSNTFTANWEESVYSDSYQVNLVQIEGNGITKVSENFDSVNSNGKPLPENWTGTASGNYTTTASSGKNPNALGLKNDLEFIQTPFYSDNINKFQFTYKYPSNATGSYLLVISIDSIGNYRMIDSIGYSNTKSKTISYNKNQLTDANSIKIEYHKIKGNISIDDIEYEYGSTDTIFIDSVYSQNNKASFYSLKDSTTYYYNVNVIANSHNSSYISKPSNLIKVTTLDKPTTTDVIIADDDRQITIYSIYNEIILENMPLNSTVKVYNLEGKLLHNFNSSEPTHKIQLPKKQSYIIQISNYNYTKTYKINI